MQARSRYGVEMRAAMRADVDARLPAIVSQLDQELLAAAR